MPVSVVPQLPESAADPRMRQIYDYWRDRLPEDRLLPGRQHIDPLEMPKEVLPYLSLIEVQRAETGRRFRFRLAGTAYRDWAPFDYTGRFLEDLPDTPERGRLFEMFDKIVNQPTVHYMVSRRLFGNHNGARLRRLGLPLASGGYDVDMILAVMLPDA